MKVVTKEEVIKELHDLDLIRTITRVLNGIHFKVFATIVEIKSFLWIQASTKSGICKLKLVHQRKRRKFGLEVDFTYE